MTNGKIIWAVDILGDRANLQQKSRDMALRLSKKLHTKIVPTFVLGPIPYIFHPNIEDKQTKAYLIEMKRHLESVVKELGGENLDRCAVLVAQDATLKGQTETLIEFAKSEGAAVIVVSTQARKALPRLFLGSFAETLLLRSPVPLVLVRPNSKTQLPKDIVFPTDFSQKAFQSLRKASELAKAIGATVQIFHNSETIVPVLGESSLYFSHMDKIIDQSKKQHLLDAAKKGEALVASLKELGVKSRFSLGKGETYTVEAILKFSKKFPQRILAISSISQPGLGEVLGGIARRVVREAECVVWVVHPGDTTETKKKYSPVKNYEQGLKI